MPLVGEYEPSASPRTREEVERFERTGGNLAEGLEPGRPIVVLTSVGAKSGKLRKFAVIRVEHEGSYAVVASKGGAPKNPTWYHNLVANPHCEVQDGAVKRDYRARLTEGDDRQIWWQRACAVWPEYETYQSRTDRVIPVFVLEPIGS